MSQSELPIRVLPIRVLIVDDHPLMREALAAALHGEPDLQVAGMAANGVQALQHYQALQPDVVIMDLMMPVRDGVSATADILAYDAAARVLVLTSAVDDARVVQALSAGAQGYLLKEAEREQLLEGVRVVANGDFFLPSKSAGKLVHALQQGALGTAAQQPSLLSARQAEVLMLAAGGLSDAQIADRLVLSESTVRVHLHHVIEKLGVADRAEAVAWYMSRRKG